MNEDIRRRDRKRWTLFGLGLLVPILLVAMLFFAASQDVKTKRAYDAERENYAKQRAAAALASDPEVSTSQNQ